MSPVIPLHEHPEYIAAREIAARVEAELQRLDHEIALADREIIERAQQSAAADPLGRALQMLDTGAPPELSDLRASLVERRNKIAPAAEPAREKVRRVGRELSRQFMREHQAQAVLKARESLVLALEGVHSSDAPFAAVRQAALAAGYDPEEGSLSVYQALPYVEWAAEWLPELRRETEALRDSLDPSLDAGEMLLRALADLPAFGLKAGEAGQVPVRAARELIRDARAEPVEPGEQATRRRTAPQLGTQPDRSIGALVR